MLQRASTRAAAAIFSLDSDILGRCLFAKREPHALAPPPLRHPIATSNAEGLRRPCGCTRLPGRRRDPSRFQRGDDAPVSIPPGNAIAWRREARAWHSRRCVDSARPAKGQPARLERDAKAASQLLQRAGAAQRCPRGGGEASRASGFDGPGPHSTASAAAEKRIGATGRPGARRAPRRLGPAHFVRGEAGCCPALRDVLHGARSLCTASTCTRGAISRAIAITSRTGWMTPVSAFDRLPATSRAPGLEQGALQVSRRCPLGRTRSHRTRARPSRSERLGDPSDRRMLSRLVEQDGLRLLSESASKRQGVRLRAPRCQQDVQGSHRSEARGTPSRGLLAADRAPSAECMIVNAGGVPHPSRAALDIAFDHYAKERRRAFQ